MMTYEQVQGATVRGVTMESFLEGVAMPPVLVSAENGGRLVWVHLYHLWAFYTPGGAVTVQFDPDTGLTAGSSFYAGLYATRNGLWTRDVAKSAWFGLSLESAAPV